MALGQEEIGRRIKEARDDANLTQRELGDILDVEAQTISRWERAEIEVSQRRLRQIAQATRKPIDFFIQGADSLRQLPEAVADQLLLEIAEIRQDLLDIRGAVQRLEDRLPPAASHESEHTSA